MNRPLTLALLFGALTGAAFAGGNLIYVDDSWAGITAGEDPDGDGPAMMFGVDSFDNIHDAYDAAVDGDEIVVHAGTYTLATTLIIEKQLRFTGPQAGVDPRPTSPLRVAGMPSDPRQAAEYLGTREGLLAISAARRVESRGGTIRTAGDSNTEAIIEGTGIAPAGGLFSVRADNVSINGFEFRNAPDDMIGSPDASPITALVIADNIVHDSTSDEGIQIRNSTETLVFRNHVYNTFGDGINLCCGTTDGAIVLNELHNDGPDTNGMIYVYDLDAADREMRVTIRGNYLYNILTDDAIEVGGRDGEDIGDRFVWVLDNIINDAADDGIEVHMREVMIARNTFRNISGDGGGFNGAVSVEDGGLGVYVVGNTFEDMDLSDDPTSGAVSVQGGIEAYVLVYNNHFRNVSPMAIWFGSGVTSGRVEVANNIFEGNAAVATIPADTENLWYNNRFLGSTDIAFPDIAPGAQFTLVGNHIEELPLIRVPESRRGVALPSSVNGNYYPGLPSFFEITDDLASSESVLLSEFDDPGAVRDNGPMHQLDRDADGLNDGYEDFLFPLLSAFDPTQFDSIAPGYHDGAVTLLFLTGFEEQIVPPDALNIETFEVRDNDGDGYPDWYESWFFSDPLNPDETPNLGDVTRDNVVDLGDAIRALQVMNGTIAPDSELWLGSDLDAINVTGTRTRSLNNALQILRFQNGSRLQLPANGIIN